MASATPAPPTMKGRKKLEPDTYQPPWPAGADKRLPVRKHFNETGEHKSWNFLHGEGPSSVSMYYADEPKAFRPTWKSMRHVDAINPDTERKAATQYRENRNATTQELRKDRLTQWNQYNQFNPIAHTNVAPDGRSTAPNTNGWQHQKLGLHPVDIYKPRLNNDTKLAARQSEVRTMREQRIANDGLTSTKRMGGTVKELMNWQS